MKKWNELSKNTKNNLINIAISSAIVGAVCGCAYLFIKGFHSGYDCGLADGIFKGADIGINEFARYITSKGMLNDNINNQSFTIEYPIINGHRAFHTISFERQS